MNPFKRLCPAAFFVCACSILHAQQPKFLFAHFSTDNGLSSNNILCMTQDNRGFFWMGTSKGVERFDGRWFMPWLDASLPGYCFTGPVEQIFTEEDNRLLLRSGRTVAFYDLRTRELKVVAVNEKATNDAAPHYSLMRDSHENTFLLIERKGLLLLNRKANCFEEKGLPFQLPSGFEPLQITEDTVAKKYWVTGHDGIFCYNILTGNAEYKGHSSSPFLNKPELQGTVASFFVDRQRRYWAMAWVRNTPAIFCFDEKNDRFLSPPSFENIAHSYTEPRHFYQQRAGGLWAYGVQSLMKYTEGRNCFTNIQRTDPLNPVDYNVVNTVFEDKERNLWIATDNGLYVARAQTESVINLSLGNEGGDSEITGIEETEGGYLLSTGGKGLLFVNYDLRPVHNDWLHGIRYPKPPYQQIQALHRQKSTGTVWAACEEGGLFCLNREAKQIRFLQPPVLKAETVRCIGEDKDGNLWFGTQKGLVVKYTQPPGEGPLNNNNDFVVIAHINAPVNNFCTDGDNNLWVATGEAGIYQISVYTNQVTAHLTAAKNGLVSNDVGFIKSLNDTTLVVGGARLQSLHPRTQIFTTLFNDASPFVGIRSATVDAGKNLWLLGEAQLYKYAPSTRHVSTYGKNEGLLNLKDVGNTAFTAANGTILLAGLNYLLSFHPQEVSSRAGPPPVVITDFRLFDKFLPIDSLLAKKRIVLPADQNSFAVFFTAISFLQQHSLSYSYQLQGVDNGWVNVNRLEPATYNLLPPGDYVFKTRCENNEGLVSTETATLYITIKPHYWQTGWFIAAVVLVLAALGFSVYRLRRKQRLAVEKLRGKVARDLHDDVGATLTTINILSSVAQAKVEKDAEVSSFLGKINDNSSRMMEAMDDIIWSINPANDSMEKITYRMREYALTLLEARGIEYDFRVADAIQAVKIGLESRRDLFLIYKEAVNNLVKYSQCSYAEISVDRADRELIILVKDNGKGFDADTVKKGNGLTNMQKRARSLKGELRLITQPGKGTTVVLKMPVP